MGSTCSCERDAVRTNTDLRGITNEAEHDVLCIKVLQVKRLTSGNFIPNKPNEAATLAQQK